MPPRAISSRRSYSPTRAGRGGADTAAAGSALGGRVGCSAGSGGCVGGCIMAVGLRTSPRAKAFARAAGQGATGSLDVIPPALDRQEQSPGPRAAQLTRLAQG